MKSWLLLGSLILGIGEGSAYHLKADKTISIPVACGSLLRIALKGDLIQDVVIYPEKLSDRITLHKSGQVFLDTKNLTQPVTLFLISQRNVTQDMKLYCDSKCSGGPLIIEPEERPTSTLIKEDPKLSHLIKKALRDDLERGTHLPRGSNRGREEIEWKGDKYWQVDDHLLERYEAKNSSSRVVILRPETFQEKDDFAISFDRDFLEPNQKAVMVVVRRKDTANSTSQQLKENTDEK